MNKVTRHLKNILAYIWLFTSIACAVVAIITVFQAKYKDGALFLLFATVAFFFYNSRRKELKQNKV